MKYATLLLAIVLASIATARAFETLNCNGTMIEPIFLPTCPASVPPNDCRSVKLEGYKITNAPLEGFDFRLKTKPPAAALAPEGRSWL